MGISQTVMSNLEIGEIGSLSIATFRGIARAVGAEAVVSIKWRGADLDRLLDEGHAAIVGAVIELLAGAGWEIHPEVSFSVYGERGSIDVLAWHAVSRTLLVVEVKTELVSLEETIRKLDVKIRLAPEVAAERFGWKPAFRAHVLVLPDSSTQRRRVARHGAVLDLAMPVRGDELRTWIKAPDRSVGGVLFLALTTGAGARRGGLSRKRIRLTRAEAAERGLRATDEADGAKHN